MKYLILPLFLILTACNQATVKEETPDAGASGDPVEMERLADEAYEARDWETSEAQYRRLIKALPTEAKPWFRLGNIYAYNNRADEAVLAYREALVRRPDFTKAWHNMGVLQLRQAAKTFNDLTIHGSADSPLYQQASDLHIGILKLLSQEQQGQ